LIKSITTFLEFFERIFVWQKVVDTQKSENKLVEEFFIRQERTFNPSRPEAYFGQKL